MKRIISLLLCMIIIIVPLNNVAFAENMTELSSLETDLLSALDIFEEPTKATDAFVTRGTYAKALAKALAMPYSEDDLSFYKELVRYSDEGAIVLDGYVKYGEVICGIITALGYDTLIEFSGQGAQGYLSKAQNLKISSGFSLKFDDYVTEKQLVTLISRALSAPMMLMQSISSNGSFDMEINEDKNLLSEYHKIYRGKGQITANEWTTLSGGGGLRQGQVCIGDDFIVYTGKTDAKFLLGYSTEFYYHYDKATDNGTLVSIYADSDKNRELYLTARELDSYSNQKYKYYENNKTKTATLEKGSAFVYNGAAVSASKLTETQLVPKTGEITLLDTNDNGQFDVVLIMDYSVEIFDRYDAEKNRLYLKSETKEMADIEKINIFDALYNDMTFSDIKKGSVIWMAVSANGDCYTLLVSESQVSGRVETIGEDDSRPYFVINDQKYYAAQSFDTTLISVGSSGIFMLDIENCIADFTVSSDGIGENKNFAYVINGKIDEVFDSELTLLVFDGEIKTYPCKSRVIVNGKTYSDHKKLYEELSTPDGATRKFNDQLMIVRVNDENQIAELETAAPAYDSNEPGRFFIEGQVPKQGEGTGAFYRGAAYGNIVMNYFALENSAKVFKIPDDRTRIEDYSLGGPETIADGADVYGLTGYKIGDDTAKCVAAVYESTAGVAPLSNEYILIADIAKTMNADMDVIDEVTYYNLNKGTKGSAYVEDEDIRAQLSVGDIVNMDINSRNVVSNYGIIYSYKDDALLSGAVGGAYYSNRWMKSTVVKKMDDAIKVKSESVPISYIENELLLLNYATIHIIDVGKNEITARVGTANDISLNEEIMYFAYRGSNLRIFVYKK